MAPMDAIFFFAVQMWHLPNNSWLILAPYKSAGGIGYASTELSKIAGNSASYPLNTWQIDRV